MTSEDEVEQLELIRDLAAHFRRLRCRAGEVIVQLGVMCERAPAEPDLRPLAARLPSERRRAELFTACVNLEVSLQEAQKWSGRVLSILAEAQTAVEHQLAPGIYEPGAMGARP